MSDKFGSKSTISTVYTGRPYWTTQLHTSPGLTSEIRWDESYA